MFEAGMFELGSRGEVLWVMVERGVWRQTCNVHKAIINQPYFDVFFCIKHGNSSWWILLLYLHDMYSSGSIRPTLIAWAMSLRPSPRGAMVGIGWFIQKNWVCGVYYILVLFVYLYFCNIRIFNLYMYNIYIYTYILCTYIYILCINNLLLQSHGA